jgi:LysM repeat protein
MNNRLIKHILSVAFLFFACTAFAQYRNYYPDYIDQYKDMAIEQMNKYKIPASITLAQGLFESGAGMSELARNGNNHFGIKCGASWTGPTVYHNDDAPNECFRAYSNARDSYEDHSQFLQRNQRYRALFSLDITDYRGWAIGLKKAGYATDPSYANRLIAIIEEYQLYKYDRGEGEKHGRHHREEAKLEQLPVYQHQVALANDVVYIVARNGDTFEGLSKEFGISARKLVKYNDVNIDYTLQAGDIVYLHKKQKRAADGCILHVVSDGDSMHSISQKYGMRLKNLYKLNSKTGDYVPMVGDILRLR